MSLAPLSMVYRSEKQLPHLFQNLQGFYRTGDFCDVVLNVGPCRISAHGVILAAFSPYLCSLLQGDLDSRRRTELSLQNIDHIGLRCLIDYCYSGVITVDSSSADKILGVAKTLQVKEIEKLCLTFLTAQQNFSSELAYDAVKQGSNLTNTPQSRGSSCTKVESSGRYSPRTSPNVSTSGQPSSETGSTGHPDSDIVTIKVEAPEHLNTENEHQAYNRGRMLYVDIADDGSILERRRQINPSSGPGVIDMTKMSPTLLTSPLYPISSMMIPTAPPSLQLMSPRQEREGKSSVSRYRDDRLVKDLIPSSGRLETRTVDVEEPTDLSPQAVTGLMIPGVENTETDQQVLTCSVCHSMFSSSEALKLHMLLHQQTLTQTPETLIHHQLQVQKNEEPHELQIPHVSRGKNSRGEHSNETVSNFYRCSTCGKAFRDAQSLKFHRYNHVLRHSCNLCGKRFSRSWNLHRHRKTHFRMANWPLRADMRMNESLGSEETDADPNSSGDLMDLTGNDEETETGNTLVEHSVEEQETEEDTVVELLSGDGSDCQ